MWPKKKCVAGRYYVASNSAHEICKRSSRPRRVSTPISAVPSDMLPLAPDTGFTHIRLPEVVTDFRNPNRSNFSSTSAVFIGAPSMVYDSINWFDCIGSDTGFQVCARSRQSESLVRVWKCNF